MTEQFAEIALKDAPNRALTASPGQHRGSPSSSLVRLFHPRSILLLSLLPGTLWAQSAPGLVPSLKTIKPPEPAGLVDGPQPIVIDRDKAIALGKALFWDMNVGSDGVACASCHFHAGADARTRNQFSPGKAHLPQQPDKPNAFDPKDERGANLANYQLRAQDFPLYRFGDPANAAEDSLTLRNPLSYNTVSSAGTFSGQFIGIAADGSEQCIPFTGAGLDQTFNSGGIHTRRVEPRNTPTIINAVLFDRQFWDGRANFIFNGVSSTGPRDPNAFVWVVDRDNIVWKTRMAMENASLASQAVAPPSNEFEMSCRGRTLKDVARKLLKRRPLENQAVHPEDSALAPYRDSSGMGLNLNYEDLVKAAFASRFWSAGTTGPFGQPGYSSAKFSQAEANFPLFFGLAIQLYAATLISDDTPYDRANILVSPPIPSGGDIAFASVVTDASGTLTAEQLQGLKLFSTGFCIQCHRGPLFSAATNRNTVDVQSGVTSTRPMIERRKKFFEGIARLLEVGYANNGSVPSPNDPGTEALDEFGNPLTYSEQYMQALAGHPEFTVEPLPAPPACLFQYPFTQDFTAAELVVDPMGAQGCANAANAKVPRPDMVSSALATQSDIRLLHRGHFFKIPQLYNVELTGPYMHNGGMATLAQAVENYSRGGNFGRYNPNLSLRNGEISAPDIMLGFSHEERDAIIAFLKALTDERVRYEQAPFDHPQLFVADGHPGDQFATVSSTSIPGQAEDRLVEIPAVGAGGNATPLKPFDELLPLN